MAGSYGCEAGDKYEVSMRCAEDALLPKIRATAESALLLADGFSRRHQIEHRTGRTPLHLAEAIQLALGSSGAANGDAGPNGRRRRGRRAVVAALAGAGLAAGGGMLLRGRS